LLIFTTTKLKVLTLQTKTHFVAWFTETTSDLQTPQKRLYMWIRSSWRPDVLFGREDTAVQAEELKM
jgi:hypothetical protein